MGIRGSFINEVSNRGHSKQQSMKTMGMLLWLFIEIEERQIFNAQEHDSSDSDHMSLEVFSCLSNMGNTIW